jgi:ABC-type polysaccharide/polyol phosphate export permease
VRNFLLQARLSYKGLFLWRSRFSYVSNVFLAPILSVSLYYLVNAFSGGASRSDAIAIGVSANAIAVIVLGGITQAFYYERAFGTLPYAFSARGPRLLIYTSRGIGHLPNAILSVTAALVAARLIAHLSFAALDWALLCLSILAIALSSIAFAMCISNFCIVVRDWIVPVTAGTAVAFILTGAVIPRSELPLGIGAIGAFVPMTNGLVAMRQAFDGVGVSEAGGRVLAEIAVAAGYLALGYTIYRWVERSARNHGRYEEL